MSLEHVVVVGAGIAAVRLVQALRRRSFTGRVTMLGAEEGWPYDRPPLSKQVLSGAWPDARAIVANESVLAALDVDYRPGTTGLSLADHVVHASSGAPIAFDVLAIATGARPATLADQPEHPCVLSLRTIGDAAALRNALQQGTSLAVVGAGLIGGEVATVAHQRGVAVTLVEAADRPFARALGEAAGQVLADRHRDIGVDVCTRTTVDRWRPELSQVALDLSDGRTLTVDRVLVAVGSRPNTDWLRGSGARVEDGVECDDAGRVVGLPDVYAIGDVAAWPDTEGVPRRSQHWTSAVEQAEIAALTILGVDERPAVGPPFAWTDQCGQRINVVGRVHGVLGVTAYVDTRGSTRCVAYERDGAAVGVVTVGLARSLAVVRPAISERSAIDVLHERLVGMGLTPALPG